MKSLQSVCLRTDLGPMMRLCSVLVTTLCLSACATKPEAQQQTATPVTAAASPPSMKATLLAVAQTDATLCERPFCPISTVSKRVIRMSQAEYNGNDKFQAWVEQGYFTRTPISQSSFTLTPTPRYLEVLSHATNPDSLTPRICLGTARLSALSNLRQLNPDKFMAEAPLTPTLDPWVTPEIMKLFGPARNHPVYVPVTLIFLRSGDTWTVERR